MAEQLDQVAQKMAELTGLDIKRHDKIYWPPQDTMYHPDSPEHHFTNAHFFFSPDFDSLVKEGEYLKVAEIIGSSREKEKEAYGIAGNLPSGKTGGAISITSSSGSNLSQMYYKYYGQLRSNKDMLMNKTLALWLNLLSPFTSGNAELIELSGRKKAVYGSEQLNDFDVFFIKATYRQNSLLKHGLNNEKAAAIIAQDIWQQYQTEGV